ncbi:MAG: spore germination protein [Ruminococcaceae bacterium]|nr:spore germination protein [Oscillospiraceae bacterium]
MKIKNLFLYNPAEKTEAQQLTPSADGLENNPGLNNYIKNNIKNKDSSVYRTGKVSSQLAENLDFIHDAFECGKNFDLMVRQFKIQNSGKAVDAFLIFYDGLVNKNFINRDIMRPLMTNTASTKNSESPEDAVYKIMLTQAPNSKNEDMQSIIELVGFGNCAVFVDGCSCAFVADVKGWGTRNVGKPISEAVLSGPQEAFTETVMTNIALIRKILKDPNLIAENIPVGTKSKTPCALMYLNGITNISLVKEARDRLKAIETEYIFSSADIEMMIEESTVFPFPQLLKTERPDRAAAQLADGKVIIIVQGSPFVLILPATAADLAESSEDNYVRIAEANFMRAVRLAGCFLALFLPGIFISVVLYHHESIPTDLLFAIEATREKMPFPIVLELIIMVLSFELIKEASTRVPDPIGSTLGIVGGLILGQSAVSAGIASPLLIIIVSITALGSFAAPSVSISRALSVMQFIFIFLGATAGFTGIATGVFVLSVCLAASHPFGVPYIPASNGSDSPFFVPPIWKRESRPRALYPQSVSKQPHISRKWKGDE